MSSSLKIVLKISEQKSVLSTPPQPISNTLKRKIRTHRSSKKFNSQEYEKCRENLLNFLDKIAKTEDRNYLSLKSLNKEYKIDGDEFPNDIEIMPLFDSIYRRFNILFFSIYTILNLFIYIYMYIISIIYIKG